MENGTLKWMDIQGFEMRRVNESTIVQLASWEVSFLQQLVWQVYKKDYWHVEMRLEFGKNVLYMVFTSIYPFYVVNPFANWEKKYSRVTRACIDLLLPRTCKNLALACNKTWDDGIREMICLSSDKNYEKKTSNYL